MLRRNLLAAAAVLPVVPALAAIRYDMDTRPPPPGTWGWEEARKVNEILWNQARGFVAPPIGLIPISGGRNTIMAMIQNQQERDEVNILMNWLGAGEAAGMTYGHFTRYGGSAGALVGMGVGLVGYLWTASQVFIHRLATHGAYLQAPYYPYFDHQYGQGPQGTFLQAYGVGGMGGFGIGFPGYGQPPDIGIGMNGGWLAGSGGATRIGGKDMW